MSTSLVSLVIVTLDEEKTIERVLASALPFVDRVMLVDLGSHDDTVEIASGVIARHGLGTSRGFGPSIYQLPLYQDGEEEDASVTRNFALDQGESVAEFVWVIQGDEVLVGGAAARAWCVANRKSDASSGWMEVRQEESAGIEPRILRAGAGWRFRGRASELLTPPSAPWPPIVGRVLGCSIERTPFPRSKRVLGKDAARLRLDLGDERASAKGARPRTLLKLAETLQAMGSVDEAEALFEERIKTPSGSPEDYLALMYTADHYVAAQNLGRAGALYTAAHLRFPDRAEPFFRVAQIDMEQGLYRSALLSAQRGLGIAPPELGSALGYEPAIYQYKLALIAARAATETEKYDAACAFFDRALEEAPEAEKAAIGIERSAAGVLLAGQRAKEESEEGSP